MWCVTQRCTGSAQPHAQVLVRGTKEYATVDAMCSASGSVLWDDSLLLESTLYRSPKTGEFEVTTRPSFGAPFTHLVSCTA